MIVLCALGYVVFGLLTVIAGLRNGEIVQSDRGLLFGTIFLWPLIWFVLMLLTIIDKIGPILDKVVNKFIQVLVKVARNGKNSDV